MNMLRYLWKARGRRKIAMLAMVALVAMQWNVGGVSANTEQSSVLLQENFEGGTIEGTAFNALNGSVLTNESEKVIHDEHSVHVIAPNHSLTSLLRTNPASVQFEKNTKYAVTFTYKGIDVPAGKQSGDLRVYGYSTDYKESLAKASLPFKTGETETKTLYFNTGEKENYIFFWGIKNGGSVSIDDIEMRKVIDTEGSPAQEENRNPVTPPQEESEPKVKTEATYRLQENFEGGSVAETAYITRSGSTVTNEPTKVINGSFSVNMTAPDAKQIFPFSTAPKKMQFETNTRYGITFTYRGVELPIGRESGELWVNGFSTDWKETLKPKVSLNFRKGETETQTLYFQTGGQVNYIFFWGIKNGGSVSIDDIEIKKVEDTEDSFSTEKAAVDKATAKQLTHTEANESFEQGTFQGTAFVGEEGSITNEREKVISGNYSAYVTGPATEEGRFRLYTDEENMQFEKNTKYGVTFTYKGLDFPSGKEGGELSLAVTSNDRKESIVLSRWNVNKGESKTKTVVFHSGEKDNYLFVWGVTDEGAIALDDIKIKKIGHTESPLSLGDAGNEEVWDTEGTPSLDKTAAEKAAAEKAAAEKVVAEKAAAEKAAAEKAAAEKAAAKKAAAEKAAAEKAAAEKAAAEKAAAEKAAAEKAAAEKAAAEKVAKKIDETGIKEDFEWGTLEGTIFTAVADIGSITNESGKVINGSYSMYLPPFRENGVIYLQTKPTLKFEKNTEYIITFTYKGVESPNGKDSGELLIYQESMGHEGPIAFMFYKSKKGETQTQKFFMKTGDKENHVLKWFMLSGGAVSLDDIEIKKKGTGENGEEQGPPLKTDYEYDGTNELKRVVPSRGNRFEMTYDANGNQIETKRGIN